MREGARGSLREGIMGEGRSKAGEGRAMGGGEGRGKAGGDRCSSARAGNVAGKSRTVASQDPQPIAEGEAWEGLEIVEATSMSTRACRWGNA